MGGIALTTMFAVSRALCRGQSPMLRATAQQQIRNFNIHEYQSKILCDQHGVKVQKWRVGETAADCADGAKELVKEMSGTEIVIKAQVHAGGRGKGHFVENGYKGGVKVVDSPDDVEEV